VKTPKPDRALVSRALRLFVLDLQARFRRRVKISRAFLRQNPPCHTCAFNPSTNRERGAEATANSLRLAIAEQRPFYCHEGWPWKKPIPRWGARTLRRFLRERKFCAGWVVIVGAPGIEKAFERAGVQACKDLGR